MPKESQRERLVRSILPTATEQLHEMKAMMSNSATRESDVEDWLGRFLRGLGYVATEGYSVRAQEGKANMRPDLVIYLNEKPIIIVEVKKLGFDLHRSSFRSGKVQLREYLSNLGDIRWGILSNGVEWKLYDFKDTTSGIEILDLSLPLLTENGAELIDTSKRAVEEFCYDLADLHECTHKNGNWEELSKEATAFSPESLVTAITSVDVVRSIAKTIRGDLDYKVNTEILFDKVFDLLKIGLDDAVPGWNETRENEFKKHIKLQKKAARRKKKAVIAGADLKPQETNDVTASIGQVEAVQNTTVLE